VKEIVSANTAKSLSAGHADRVAANYAPPCDPHAEMAVLGAMMLGQEDANLEALPRLSPGDFYYPAHNAVYRAMGCLINKGQPVDIVTVKDELTRAGVLDKCGGVSFLMELGDFVPTTANIAHYQGIVADYSLRRSLIKVCGNIGASATSGEVTGRETLETLKKAVTRLDILSNRGRLQYATMEEVSAEAVEYLASGSMHGYRIGLPDIDNMLGGIRQSETTVIGAGPGTGKTALAIQWAVACAEAGAQTLFVSGEMPARGIYIRAAFAIADINAQELKKRSMTQEEADRYKKACRYLNSLPINIVDARTFGGPITATGIISLARRTAPRVVMVDYLQKITPDTTTDYGANRQAEVQAISKILSTGFVELDVAGLVLAQLNRQGQSSNTRPDMRALRESGAIEADANNIILLYEESKEEPQSLGMKYSPAVVGFNLDKQRDGVTGVGSFAFDKRFGRFAPIATATAEGGGYITNDKF
jgi:replicative DNA helicase